MYGSTEGSTETAKSGKPCGVRVFSRNIQSINTVSKAPVALRSSPRDNKLLVCPPLAKKAGGFFLAFFVDLLYS